MTDDLPTIEELEAYVIEHPDLWNLLAEAGAMPDAEKDGHHFNRALWLVGLFRLGYRNGVKAERERRREARRRRLEGQ